LNIFLMTEYCYKRAGIGRANFGKINVFSYVYKQLIEIYYIVRNFRGKFRGCQKKNGFCGN